MNKATSILVFRNGSIGNTLVAVPALRALRTAYPAVRLAVVVDPIGFELLEHCPWIDTLIVYDKRGRDRGVLAHVRLIRTLRALHPTHAILFKRFFRNGLLAFLSGAPVRLGFVTAGRSHFLNRTIPYDESVHHVDLNLKLLQLIDIHSNDRRLETFLSTEDHLAAENLLRDEGLCDQDFLVAHYGGHTWRTPECIPPKRFIELLQRMANGSTVVFIGSGAQESAWAQSLQREWPQSISTCDLPLRTMAALTQRARLFIGFNSGPSHVAAAVGTPLLMIFQPGPHAQGQIRRWLPPSPTAHPLIPPETSDDVSWNEFFDHARRLLEHTVDRSR